MPTLSGIVGLVCALSAHAYIGPTANVIIANKAIAPDGFRRSAVLAGASANTVSFPGPVIRAAKGDNFRLNVVDLLTDTTMLVSTSIHWHGFYQKETSWADGAAGVTQCPIAPGHAFLYQFSTANQAGTFWYHSHYSTQYCDGLRGAMVVYDPFDPYLHWYDCDDESTIITLADWYHTAAPVAGNAPKQIQSLSMGKVAILVDQKLRSFTFSIDGHTMTIIEVDSVNVQPLTVDNITIYAGQRYSFILYANNHIGNYWIRSAPAPEEDGPEGFEGGINSAILRYWFAPPTDPITQSYTRNPLVETNLHPLSNPAAPGVPYPGAADVNINLKIDWNNTTRKFTVNNASFGEIKVPVLLQILSGSQAATDLLPAGSVYTLPPNKVVELSMPGGSIGSPHPMHLHGHDFSVVRSAGSPTYNFVNPVRRDVVNLGKEQTDNVTIRFKTDNSGPWIMHCHIDWHLEEGLAVVFAENTFGIKQSSHPPAWDQLCPIFDALPQQTFN